MKDAYEVSLGCWLRSRYKVSDLPFYDHVLMSELGFQIVIGSPDNCLKKPLEHDLLLFYFLFLGQFFALLLPLCLCSLPS